MPPHLLGALVKPSDEVVREMAARCGIPEISDIAQAKLVLSRDDKLAPLLALCWGQAPTTRFVPFSQAIVPLRHTKDPLVRAMGAKDLTVLDATAGWGEDAARLVMNGYAVTAVERLPVIHEITKFNWQSCMAAQCDLQKRVQWVCAETLDILNQYLSEAKHCDVVYLDPMFPDKRRQSAAAKKPLKILQALAAAPTEIEAEQLLSLSRKVARKRVVVKRALKAPVLTDVMPSGSVKGKLVRFDLYSPE